MLNCESSLFPNEGREGREKNALIVHPQGPGIEPRTVHVLDKTQ